MSNEDTKSEAERFSLPSQFVMEEDTEQYRLKTDKVYTYHRDGELVIQIDFSDFAINKDDIDRLGEEAVINQIQQDALVLAMKLTGGLKPGDVEKLNNEEVRVLTETEIEDATAFIASHQQFMSDPQQTETPNG